MQLLVLVDELKFLASFLCKEWLDQLVGNPKHPVGIDNVEVAESLAVKVLQHRDHLQGKFD